MPKRELPSAATDPPPVGEEIMSSLSLPAQEFDFEVRLLRWGKEKRGSAPAEEWTERRELCRRWRGSRPGGLGSASDGRQRRTYGRRTCSWYNPLCVLS
jgi:hypothetical protein